MRIILFIVIAVLPASEPVRDWNMYRWWPLNIEAQNQTVVRMLRLMQSFYESGEQRILHLNDKRAYYEQSKEFEEGYIMGEIIEKYRRLVEHIKISQKLKSYTVIDVVTRMELAQRIYFEVFHLVNMMHELPRKYGYYSEEEEAADGQPADNPIPPKNESQVEAAIEDLEKLEQRRIKEAKAHKKKMKKMREMLLLEGKRMTQTTKDNRKNKWWPLEYGWEIDYWW